MGEIWEDREPSWPSHSSFAEGHGTTSHFWCLQNGRSWEGEVNQPLPSSSNPLLPISARRLILREHLVSEGFCPISPFLCPRMQTLEPVLSIRTMLALSCSLPEPSRLFLHPDAPIPSCPWNLSCPRDGPPMPYPLKHGRQSAWSAVSDATQTYSWILRIRNGS